MDAVEEPTEFSRDGRFSTKATRIQEAKITQEKLPESYRFNSHKEELCLKYAENFVSQLESIFPEREPGFVAPLNECGIPKLVCTTLRPTQLPYRDLYDAEKCAKFISNFIDFEPLEKPTQLPSTLPSPTLTLANQVGDSFDMATVLCSYLIGAGYDAYCVFGTAPRNVTLHDTSQTKCFLPEDEPPCFRERIASKSKGITDPPTEPDQTGQPSNSDSVTPGESKDNDVEEVTTNEENVSGEDGVELEGGDETRAQEVGEEEKGEGKEIDESKVDPPDELNDLGGAIGVPGVQEVMHDDPYHVAEFVKETSKYEKEMAKRGAKMQAEMDAALQQEILLASNKDSEEEEVNDPLEGKRVHCWVLVRAGKRMVEQNFFLEPTTGSAYAIDECPYLGINSIWNNCNYWFNVGSVHERPEELCFNLTNTDQWEYIFYDAQLLETEGKNDSDDGESDLDDDIDEKKDEMLENENVLDLPPSWVVQLTIPRDAYRRKYGTTGQKVELLYKAKRELYAPYTHSQGLITRIFLFDNVDRTSTDSIHEYFVNRRDKLEKRVRYPKLGKVVEHFLEGRPSGLKCLTEVAGKRKVFEFFTAARLDGLVHREEQVGKKVVETFVDRDDLLTWRSVTVAGGSVESLSGSSDGIGNRTQKEQAATKGTLVLPMGQLGDLTILKMTEKFDRHVDQPADSSIAKRTFFIQAGSIRVLYHYEKGRVTRSSRTFFKDRSNPPEVSIVNEFAPPIRPSQLENEFQQALQGEKDCYQSARDSEREAQDIIALRRREEHTIVLEKSVFDTAQERNKEDILQDTQTEEKVEKDGRQVDYLTLFLPHGASTQGPLTREQAESAREACLRALKERLLERANIIQRRLDEENMQLAKKQAAFQRSRDHVEGADEEFETFCSEAMFRIQILEQRLARHEETALQKYAEMDHKLRNDPRLTNL